MTTLCLCDFAGYDAEALEARLRAEHPNATPQDFGNPPRMDGAPDTQPDTRRREAPAWMR